MNWRYAAASVAGTSHLASGTGCQDSHRCEVMTDAAGHDVFIAAVSDGAGSAKQGASGSAITTAVLMEQCSAWLRTSGTVRSLDADRMRDWLDGVRENIANEAGSTGLEMRDFAATLLFVAIDGTSSAFAQIGDGAIVTSEKPGEWDAEFWPQRGTYANQTYFVTDDTAHEQLLFAQSIRTNREVAVFTDGLERLLLNYAEHQAHGPAFEKMLQPLRTAESSGHIIALSDALSRYLTSSPVTTRTDDDVTLVIASRF